jgi:transcriptional regulator with XRE-family HTH domain
MDGKKTHNVPMTVGQALDAEIRRRKMTQGEAAEQMGVSKQVVSWWISGRGFPSGENLPKVARFLRMKQDDVIALGQPETVQSRVARIESDLRAVIRINQSVLDAHQKLEKLQEETLDLLRQLVRQRESRARR